MIYKKPTICYGRLFYVIPFLMIHILSVCLILCTEPIALELDSNAEQRNKIAYSAHSHLGANYVYGGEKPTGFDCSGFTKYIYKTSIGINLPHGSKLQSKLGNKIKLKKAQKGDLIFFKKGNKINHVGIIYKLKKDEIWVIHSTTSKGVILEDIKKNPYWQKKVVAIRSIL